MEEFRFKMDGPAFEKGIPLHLALGSLQDVQSIFDKTYLGLSGKQRISKHDREQFQLRTFDIRNGSLESDLLIFLEQAQLSLPAILPLIPTNIWEYTKLAFDFLQYVYAAAHKNEPVKYQANDNGTMNVITGDNVAVYNGTVINIAHDSAQHWRSLNHKLKQGQIDQYSLGSVSNPEISLTTAQRGIFDIPSHIDEEPLTLTCDIFDFNKKDNVGRLAVGEDEEIPAGNYRFVVMGSQDKINYIASMARSAVQIKALREVRADPVGDTKVVCLHVISVNP